MRRVNLQIKNCIVCGDPIPRRRWPSSLESPDAYRRRKVCRKRDCIIASGNRTKRAQHEQAITEKRAQLGTAATAECSSCGMPFDRSGLPKLRTRCATCHASGAHRPSFIRGRNRGHDPWHPWEMLSERERKAVLNEGRRFPLDLPT